MLLDLAQAAVTLNKQEVLAPLDLHLKEGQWLMVLGPNGAGKTTLIQVISQAVPFKGEIKFKGRSLKTYTSRERARSLAVLPQIPQSTYAYTVQEVVTLGRYAHTEGWFSHLRPKDHEKIHQALALTGLETLAQRSILDLSGGERQRTFLAQVLAQDPQLLLLDEPTNHLDIKYQALIFRILSDWLSQGDRAILSVVHDLSLAKVYGTHALLLNRGQAISQGPIDLVMQAKHLNSVYQTDVFQWYQDLLQGWSF